MWNHIWFYHIIIRYPYVTEMRKYIAMQIVIAMDRAAKITCPRQSTVLWLCVKRRQSHFILSQIGIIFKTLLVRETEVAVQNENVYTHRWVRNNKRKYVTDRPNCCERKNVIFKIAIGAKQVEQIVSWFCFSRYNPNYYPLTFFQIIHTKKLMFEKGWKKILDSYSFMNKVDQHIFFGDNDSMIIYGL